MIKYKVSLEQNPLYISDTLAIFKKLEKQLFHNIDSLGILLTLEILKLALPTLEELLPGQNTNHVLELRNYILISYYITLNDRGITSLSIANRIQLSMIILWGTDAEALYASI